MILARNLGAGLISSVLSAAVQFAVVPIYLRQLGIKNYGLIGFFATMQALFQIFDVGLAPTINREVARARGSGDFAGVRVLLRSLAFVYAGVSSAIALISGVAAPYLAGHWLHSTLPPADVARAVMMMGLVVAARWPIGLYLGALMGSERLVAASAINFSMVALGSVGAAVMLALFGARLEVFFGWQIAVAGLNLWLMRHWAWRALGGRGSARFSWAAVRAIWRFAGLMALTMVAGALTLQVDKLYVSRSVPLAMLAEYTLAGMAMRVLALIFAPVFSAIYPRITSQLAAGNEAEVARLYRVGTRLLGLLVFPAACYVSVFTVQIY